MNSTRDTLPTSGGLLADVPAAMKIVLDAMRSDPEYAWGWHCNIAMAFVDEGGDHATGNQAAARFMRLLAGVEPAHELPAKIPPAAPIPRDMAKMVEEAKRLYREAIQALVDEPDLHHSRVGIFGQDLFTVIDRLAAATQARVAQPFAWTNPHYIRVKQVGGFTARYEPDDLFDFPLYTSPHFALEPLSDDHICKLSEQHTTKGTIDGARLFYRVPFARAIEAAHGIGPSREPFAQPAGEDAS